jgi:hypothetical protein
LIIAVAAPGLRPRLDVELHLLGRVRRLRVAQEVLQELPIVGTHVALGQIRQLEVKEVPRPPQLAGVAQPLIELARMGRVKNGQPIDDLGMVHRQRPRSGSTPVVADHERRLGPALPDQTADVGGQLAGAVSRDAVRLRRQVVTPQVGRDDAKARRRQRRDLQPPAIPELRETMQQNDQRPVAGLDVMQPHLPHLGIALPNFGPAARHKPAQRIGRTHEHLLSRLCVIRTRLLPTPQPRARAYPGPLPRCVQIADAFSR